MITIDIGNTKTAIGYFQGETLKNTWKVSTIRHRLKDDYLVLLNQLIPHLSNQVTPEPLVVSSVIPSATNELLKLGSKFDITTINTNTHRSFDIVIENPETVGSDRIADAEAAIHHYGVPLIIIDAGTATTITVINSQKHFIGGMICPGLGISAEALFKSAAALSQIKIEPPKNIIGNSTERAIQSGVCNGHRLMIEGLITEIQAALPFEKQWKIVMTGGTSDFLSPFLPRHYVTDPSLTLKGLWLLGQLEKKGRSIG